MLLQQDFQISKKEKKAHKVWGILNWLNLLITALWLLVLIFVTLKYQVLPLEKIARYKVSLQKIKFNGLISALIGFLCAYKGDGFWFLRYYVFSAIKVCLDAIFGITYVIVFLNPIVLGAFAAVEKFSFEKALVYTLFFIIFVSYEIFMLYYIHLSWRLIKINKKRRCSKFLSKEVLEKVNRLIKLPDGDEREALYNKLTSQIPQMNWLFKRIWNRKKKLIISG